MRLVPGLIVATAGLWATTAVAGTHVLTFGGGPPSHNQISLERNVAYLQRVLAGVGLGGVRHDIYFGDGGARNSVQYRLAEGDDQRLTKALGLILADSPDADMRYAKVQIPGLVGPSSVANLDAWFEGVGRSLPPGQELLFYFTGHGGPDAEKPDQPRNTSLVMPGYPGACTVKQFAAQLDKLSPDVDVTLVMVQCYSGGFANVIYNDGDPARGFARHPRAGFFSTVASRTAAGCTPDIDEEDYHEFSTSFFEALAGETRTGKAVARPDFDGDGRTSYAEAFAHVLLTSDTIDVPTTTSDRLLRDKSRFAKPEDDPSLGLLAQDAPWSTVLAAASPSQRAALEGLSQVLGLDGEDRLARARAKTKEAAPRRGNRRGRGQNRPGNPPAAPAPEHAEHGPTAQAPPAPDGQRPQPNAAAGRLRAALAERWPELTVPLHPDAPRILAEERDEIRRFLEAQPDYKAFAQRIPRRERAQLTTLDPERQAVKYQRLLERADSVILAANLPRIADAEALGVYRRLLDLEGRTLGPARAPVAGGQPAPAASPTGS
ncbi:hypothetical protein [Paludisphaera mucosa]|uniref:Caspase domain-containing protein n=1 Tax=Paludisphaera mucosa TaxID=3030827 RepID=A0ABT6FIW7_9BACT|nr:hypothetical protein [Paludisphaera mucosa]MDG3007521.1 hypothetical protein [Paludisphaera mucosa]